MVKKQYDLIVFDWDGTLADSTQLIVNAIQKASADAGLAVPSREAASSIIGLGLNEALFELFGNIPDKTIQLVRQRYTSYYHDGENEIPLFECAFEAIEILHGRGIALGVATGKGRNGLNRALSLSGIGHFFHATRCVDECFSKPHPQMIIELMDELGVTPDRTLMVGDTSFDMQMAQNAMVDRIAVGFGAHPIEMLIEYKPLAYFDQFKKLKEWLNSNV